MVCGFGDSVSYETLAEPARRRAYRQVLALHRLVAPAADRAPAQYALADVVPLRRVYEKLAERLAGDRAAPIGSTRRWRRSPIPRPTGSIRPRRGGGSSCAPTTAACWRWCASWRAGARPTAQQRDLPRNRVLRDEALLGDRRPRAARPSTSWRARAASARASPRAGSAARSWPWSSASLALPEATIPSPTKRRELPPGLGPLVDLLRVLLKLRAEENDVAQRLVADAEDLEAHRRRRPGRGPRPPGLAPRDFGRDALDLKHGRLALTAAGKRVRLVPLPAPAIDAAQ